MGNFSDKLTTCLYYLSAFLQKLMPLTVKLPFKKVKSLKQQTKVLDLVLQQAVQVQEVPRTTQVTTAQVHAPPPDTTRKLPEVPRVTKTPKPAFSEEIEVMAEETETRTRSPSKKKSVEREPAKKKTPERQPPKKKTPDPSCRLRTAGGILYERNTLKWPRH